MDRKDFLKQCGLGCLGTVGVTPLLSGCSAKIFAGKIEGDDMLIPLKDFETRAGKETHYKKYVVVQNELLQHPICVYRLSNTEYSALWMKCTHQGAELQVFGNMLQCPAHGSEFKHTGEVQGGPADRKLRTFPVTIEKDHIKISLKAV